MRHEKSCGGVVFKREEDGSFSFLLIEHLKGGHWAFPKGHMEKGESERHTARREIWEETGVSGKFIKGFRRRVSYNIRNLIQKDVIFILYEIPSNSKIRIQEEEIARAGFFSESEVPSRLTYENDRETFSRAVEKLHQIYRVK